MVASAAYARQPVGSTSGMDVFISVLWLCGPEALKCTILSQECGTDRQRDRQTYERIAAALNTKQWVQCSSAIHWYSIYDKDLKRPYLYNSTLKVTAHSRTRYEKISPLGYWFVVWWPQKSCTFFSTHDIFGIVKDKMKRISPKSS